MAVAGMDLAAKLSNAGRAADCYPTPKPQGLVGDMSMMTMALLWLRPSQAHKN